MSSNGRWFVLFPSWRMPAPEAIDAAVRRMSKNAIVQGAGYGPFDIAEGPRSVGIGVDRAPHVFIEANEIASKIEKSKTALASGGIPKWIASCDARFVISYELAHGVDLLNTMIAASDILRKLTGGAVYDAHKGELLDPPLDQLTKEEYALLHTLESYAKGGPAPPDLVLEHYATSVHVTMLTSAHATGEVAITNVMGNSPRARAMGPAADVREAAKTLGAFGFPHVTSPKGAPVPRPTNPPVRVGLSANGVSLDAELPAEHVSLVPAFQASVTALARLGDPVRRGQEAASAALLKARDGAWPEGLTISARFLSDPIRSFEVLLGADSNLVEVERLGTRERRSVLGFATLEEKTSIAQAILAATFPHSHGSMKKIVGPHYLLRVALGDVHIDVRVDGEDIFKRGSAEAIRQLYAGAARFGKRPLTLREDVPIAPGPRSSARYAQEVLELVNGRIAFPTFARWLAEQRALVIPGEGAFLPLITNEPSGALLRVFTSQTTYDAWAAAAEKPPFVIQDANGASIINKVGDRVTRIDVDPGSPITLQIHGDMLVLLRGIARGVLLERSFATPDAEGSAQAILDYAYRVAWRPDPPPPLQERVASARMVSVPGSQGEALAAVFSADDAAYAFVNASGGATSGMTLGSMTGKDLFGRLQFLGCQGVALNPSGPGLTKVLSSDACARLLAPR